MVLVAKERPGVFSDYEASGILWGARSGNKIALAALNSEAQAGKIYRIARVADAYTLFGEEGDMAALCALLFQNGAAEVLAAPVEQDTKAAYETAFALLQGEEGVCAVVCDSTKEEVLLSLKESVAAASGQNRERIGVAACAQETDDYAAAARALQSERMVLINQSPLNAAGEALPRPYLAAALAAALFQSGDPGESRNGLLLKGIEGATPALDEEEVDAYIEAGVCPLEKTAGAVSLIRAVTTRTIVDGQEDKSLRELSTVLIIDDVMQAVRRAMQSLLRRKNSARTLSAIATQAALVLQEKYEQEYIASFVQPVAIQDPQDASVCVVELQFTVANPLNQIQVYAHIAV